MLQVLLRALPLLKRPAVALVGLVLGGGGCALAFLPLFEVPGYELSAALAVGLGILGGVPGMAAAFQERRLLQGRDPRPPGALRRDSPLGAVLLATAAAFVVDVLLVAPPVLFAAVRSLLSSRCDPWTHAGFYPVLVLPSAAIAAAAGVLCGLWARRARGAIFLYFLLLVGSAAATAWPLIQGPQVFAFNHFAGYVPGPLYDEALTLRASLGWFRLETLGLAGALVALGALLLDLREGRLGLPGLRPLPAMLLAALVAAVIALEQRAPALGFRMTSGYLEARLGGARQTAHFSLVYPRSIPREEVDRLERDLEFRHAQLSAFLGGAPEGKIRVYVYRSAAEKQELVGAAWTQFAKPWRLELHLNALPFPNRVLKHELAHVMAAPHGSGPFRVTSRLGVWPVMGIVEGLAVAADDPADELTLHQWAAGMRRQQLAPDIRRVLDPRGFYGSAAPRAYTLVGSFLRYLADTYGPGKLTALYARGDFRGVYGRNLDALATEWESFLDALPLDPAQVHSAFARFRQGSLFARPCVREVASAEAAAADLLYSDPGRALELYQRCAQIQPEEPAFLLGQARALAGLDREGDAVQVLSALLQRVGDQPALAAEVRLALAELELQRGRLAEAKAELERVIGLAPTPGVERTARVLLATADSQVAGPAVRAYLRPGGEDGVELLDLRDALEREPGNAYLAYLLGRRLSAASPRRALGYLERALQAELPESLRREALRLRLEAHYLAGDCAGVRADVGQLPDLGAAFKARALEWVARCDFEERLFKGPLVPDGPFR